MQIKTKIICMEMEIQMQIKIVHNNINKRAKIIKKIIN